MKIPPYWAKETFRHEGGEIDEVRACGWSFVSFDEARQAARERAQRVWELLAGGNKPERYEYLDRPIREEIVDQVGPEDQPAALITRNRYGALVLNTANVLFVDVDFPDVRARGLFDGLLLMLSNSRYQTRRQALVEHTLDRVEQWCKENSHRSLRIYKTHSGLRLLFTDKLYDPSSRETHDTLSQLEADPMYVRLTQAQECFRARLTAKPWRCGVSRPPHAYPWANEEEKEANQQWLAEYERQTAGCKVCDLVTTFGSPARIDELTEVMSVHDRHAGVDLQAKLA